MKYQEIRKYMLHAKLDLEDMLLVESLNKMELNAQILMEA